MLIQLSGGGQVTLFVGYVPLLIDRPGGAAAIAEFLKKLRRLTQCPLCTRIVAANFNHIGEVVKASRSRRPVWQHMPAGEASFKIAFR
jgi:hypothetical protein